jgi:hypothetical protein
MNAVAENKRRVLAVTATLTALVAIGFAIGRISSSPAEAKTARATPPARMTTARVTSAPETAAVSLRIELLQAQRTRATATQQLADARAANRRLSATNRDVHGRLADAYKCQSIQRPRLFRRCVRSATG